VGLRVRVRHHMSKGVHHLTLEGVVVTMSTSVKKKKQCQRRRQWGCVMLIALSNWAELSYLSVWMIFFPFYICFLIMDDVICYDDEHS
jgi:hypothetical protein